MMRGQISIPRLLLPLLLLLSTPPCRAEVPPRVTLSTLSEETGEPLSGVLCRLVDREGKLLDYAVTDSRGEASLRLSERADRLVVALMSYESVTLTRDRLIGASPVVIRMKPTATELPEVQVKSPPVVAYRDTVSYRVDAFRVESDRSIGDVLRKLPGVEVGEAGNISYQGQPISHLYVEGQDLLADRYNLATRNLPAEAVRDVEVLEHHTHERILKKQSASKDVAMNLRLNEEYKAKPFGKADLSVGASPLLLEGKLTASMMGQRAQSMLIAEGNNTGNEVEQQYSGITLGQADRYNPLPASPLLSTDLGIDPPLPSHRYRDNESGAVSLNQLFVLTPVQTLRFNASGILDRQSGQSAHLSRYGGAEPWEYGETTTGKRHDRQLTPSLFYELNSDRNYLSDKLTLDLGETRLSTDIHTEEPDLTRDLGEAKRMKDLRLENDFRSIFRIGGLMFRGDLFARYRDLAEEIVIADDPSERYRHRRSLVHGRVSTTKALGDLLLYLSAEGDGEGNSFTVNEGTALGYRLGRLSLTPELLYRALDDKLVLNLRLPLTGISYRSGTSKRSLGALKPDLRITYTPNERFDLRLGTAVTKDLRLPLFLSSEPLKTGYRSRISYAEDPVAYRSAHVTLTGEYHNLLHMVFADATLTWQRTSRDRIEALTLEEGRLTYTPMAYDYRADRLYAGLQVSKSIIPTGTVLKTSLDLTHTVTPTLQDEVVYSVPFTYLNLSLSLEQKFASWGNLYYTANGALSRRSVDGSSSRLRTLTHRGALYLFPFKHWEASLIYEGGRMELTPGHFTGYHFLDAELLYRATEKLDLRLTGRNLLNATSYQQAQYKGINYFADEFPLRSRSLLLTASYNF